MVGKIYTQDPTFGTLGNCLPCTILGLPFGNAPGIGFECSSANIPDSDGITGSLVTAPPGLHIYQVLAQGGRVYSMSTGRLWKYDSDYENETDPNFKDITGLQHPHCLDTNGVIYAPVLTNNLWSIVSYNFATDTLTTLATTTLSTNNPTGEQYWVFGIGLLGNRVALVAVCDEDAGTYPSYNKVVVAICDTTGGNLQQISRIIYSSSELTYWDCVVYQVNQYLAIYCNISDRTPATPVVYMDCLSFNMATESFMGSSTYYPGDEDNPDAVWLHFTTQQGSRMCAGNETQNLAYLVYPEDMNSNTTERILVLNLLDGNYDVYSQGWPVASWPKVSINSAPITVNHKAYLPLINANSTVTLWDIEAAQLVNGVSWTVTSTSVPELVTIVGSKEGDIFVWNRAGVVRRVNIYTGTVTQVMVDTNVWGSVSNLYGFTLAGDMLVAIPYSSSQTFMLFYYPVR